MFQKFKIVLVQKILIKTRCNMMILKLRMGYKTQS